MYDFSKRTTIMVIDDSSTVRKIVSRALELRHEIIQADSGDEALKLLEGVTPDLILLDVEMPGLTGFDTIKLLKENEVTAEIPVIFLTGKTDLDFELQALELGAVDYINKPFANPLLIKRVGLQIALAAQQKELANYNMNLQKMVEEKTSIIKELQNAIVFTLADLVEMRDGSTGGHVLRTQSYFSLILDYLKECNIYQNVLSKIPPNLLLEASQLHDIGKVAIPDAILLKPGRLTGEEFEIMKTHTVIGHKAIMKAMELTREKEFLSFAAEVAMTHHEKWDGSGYPKGLSGEGIPIAGRIMAIVDVYDALVSERLYKPSMPHEDAIDIMLPGKGTHFDPTILGAFLSIGDKVKEINYLCV